MPQSREVSVLVLQSAIGDEERRQQFHAFCHRFARETTFSIRETERPGEADFVFLATGGVERLYADRYREMPRAIYAPRLTNAFAAMNEIRGFLAMHGETAFCFDDALGTLEDFMRVARAVRRTHGARIALFGETAPWLVASSPRDEAFRSRFRTDVRRVPWSEIEWPTHPLHPDVVSAWEGTVAHGIDGDDLTRACRLSSAMLDWVQENGVDGVAVGCFPLLSQHVSACLAVSDLLDAGYPAACENDVCSLMGMVVAKSLGLCAKPAWMANLVDIQDTVITLQHCTVGRKCLQSYLLMTHFESGANAAVAGTLPEGSDVTVFRFDGNFGRACIREGRVVQSGPNESGCRTSATVRLDAPISEPLGNHHILLFGHVGHLLQAFCRAMGISC